MVLHGCKVGMVSRVRGFARFGAQTNYLVL
jgi:hypothetical protein